MAQPFAQGYESADYIRQHGIIESKGMSLNLSVATKERDSIRAAVYDKRKSIVLHLVYKDETLYAREELPGSVSLRELSGDEAAGNLMDLLALNPDYHFSKGGFNLDAIESEGYTFEYKRAERTAEHANLPTPIHLKLFRDDGDNSILLRSIQYLDFLPYDTLSDVSYLQPKTLKFTDETTGESGLIRIHSIEYNPGLPDFLFELSAPEDSFESISDTPSVFVDEELTYWPSTEGSEIQYKSDFTESPFGALEETNKEQSFFKMKIE